MWRLNDITVCVTCSRKCYSRLPVNSTRNFTVIFQSIQQEMYQSPSSQFDKKCTGRLPVNSTRNVPVAFQSIQQEMYQSPSSQFNKKCPSRLPVNSTRNVPVAFQSVQLEIWQSSSSQLYVKVVLKWYNIRLLIKRDGIHGGYRNNSQHTISVKPRGRGGTPDQLKSKVTIFAQIVISGEGIVGRVVLQTN